MNKLQQARTTMVLRHPFFASLLLGTPCEERDDIPTAATDAKKIYYNPTFFAPMPVEHVIGVLAHEVLHIALDHIYRINNRNRIVWNYAADYAINMMLRDCGIELPKPHLFDEKWRGMNAEQIYDHLLQDAEKKGGGAGGKGHGMGDDYEAGEATAGDILPSPSAGDPAQEAEDRRKTQQRVAQAATMARLAGKLPGSLERLISEMLDPVVPWQHLLRDYMTRTSNDDETWQKRNRRFEHVVLPTRHSEGMGKIVMIGDVSGSITAEDLNRVGSEGSAIAQDCRPEQLIVLWVDTKVQREEVYEPGDPIDMHPLGGGGTDMRVGIDRALELEPDVIVLITDGHTPWPSAEPDVPLIVCCTTGVDVPVGLVVRV